MLDIYSVYVSKYLSNAPDKALPAAFAAFARPSFSLSPASIAEAFK